MVVKKKGYMKKVFLSLGSLLTVYLLLGSTALALFLPQASLTGMQMKTADLRLLVATSGGSNPSYSSSEHLNGAVTLQPGMTPYQEVFWVKNDSSVAQQLDVTLQLQASGGDWEKLKDIVRMQLYDESESNAGEWYTLNEWAAQARELPNNHLTETQQRKYSIFYDLSDTYPVDPDGDGPIQAGDDIGNELMGLSVESVQLILKATPSNL